MKNIEFEKTLDSFAKLSKQWGLGESVGRVWGFLLFNSVPVTQKEIKKGTNYSLGLISQSLKKLKNIGIIQITRKGINLYYSTCYSLIKGFGVVLEKFLEEEINPLINQVFSNSKIIEDEKVKKKINKMINEYKKLKFGILLFLKTLNTIELLDVKNIKKLLAIN